MSDLHKDTKAAQAQRRYRLNKKLGRTGSIKLGRRYEETAKPESVRKRKYLPTPKPLKHSTSQLPSGSHINVERTVQTPQTANVIRELSSGVIEKSEVQLEKDIEGIRNRLLRRAVRMGGNEFLPYINQSKCNKEMLENFREEQAALKPPIRLFPNIVIPDVITCPIDAQDVQRALAAVQPSQPPILVHPFRLLITGESEAGKTTAAVHVVTARRMTYQPVHIYLVYKTDQAIYAQLLGQTPNTKLQSITGFDWSTAVQNSLVVIDDNSLDTAKSSSFTVFLHTCRLSMISVIVLAPRVYMQGKYSVDQRHLYNYFYLFRSCWKHPTRMLAELNDTNPEKTKELDELVQTTPYSFLSLNLRPGRDPAREPMAMACRV